MRVVAIKFDGYAEGKSAFPEDVGASVPVERFTMLANAVETMASLVVNAPPDRFLSIVITGHSDCDDTSGKSVADRRKNEKEQAKLRAVSVWESVQQAVETRVIALGGDPGEAWWDSSKNITWALVYAGIGMLKHDPPSSDAERAENRRVDVLISEFPRD